MYEHVTRFIADIDAGTFDECAFTNALYHPEIVDLTYRETLDSCGLTGARPWTADVESLDLGATVALLTFVHRTDHFYEGALLGAMEGGFLRRIFVRLRELDGGQPQPTLVGFWRETDELGCCSNWHPAGFEYRGQEFATSEHWMMWQKARVMGDHASARAILEAPTPRRAKELGGLVKPYDGPLWHDVREQLVYVGVREKFLQNQAIANLLLSTGSALLAEASPHDRVWGVGIGEDDEGFRDLSGWRGSNLLGRVCMRVRSDLRVIARMDVSVRRVSRGGDEAAGSLLRSQVGRMTLVELSHIPATRSAARCYARIAQHLLGDAYPTMDAFLADLGQVSLATLDGRCRASGDDGLAVGWYELLSQLAFLQVTGQL